MRALVAYSASSTFVQTTLDYLVSFKKYSGFEADYVHVTHDAVIEFDFNEYDIIFHSYCARLCFEGYVSSIYQEKLRQFKGIKILAVQDEYDHTDILKAAIKNLGFHIVLTCVPQQSLEYVYPRSEFPDVTFITVFTGYVSDDFASNHPTPMPLAERPIMVGYRGRDIGGRYGRLGFDKFEIGRRMKDVCMQRGIAHDIAMDEQSRIYGMGWFEFLGRCRSMLGSESGSNVFDFDGSISQAYKQMMAANGGTAPSYEEFLPVVAKRDGEISMGQISPRVFECALMRTPMVLFRGHYSGAIEPDIHYIALEKDFSNIDDVLKRLEDLPALEAMAARAYDHLVGSGQFSYRVFFKMIADAALARMTAEQHSAAGMRRASEAGDAKFTVEAYKPVELASNSPDSFDGLTIRLNMPTLQTLPAEISRLEKELERQSNYYTQCIDTIAQSAQKAYETAIEGFEGTAGLQHFHHPAKSAGEVARFASVVRDAQIAWQEKNKKALVIIDSPARSPIIPAQYSYLIAFKDESLTRYRVIGENFSRMNTLFTSELSSVNAVLKKTQNERLLIALKNISSGQKIIPMIIIVIKTLANAIFQKIAYRVIPFLNLIVRSIKFRSMNLLRSIVGRAKRVIAKVSRKKASV